MNIKSKSVWFLLVLGVLSFIFTAIFKGNGILSSLLATQGVSSMIALVIIIVRDDAAHRRTLEIQDRQHFFEFSAAQHMASVTFDKHVSFCEEYIKVLLDGLKINDGFMAQKEMINLPVLMWEVRRKYVAWLTSELDMELGEIESGIRSMGIDAHRLEYLPIGEERKALVGNIIKDYAKFIGAEKAEEKDVALSKIIEQIRRILGVQELTMIRKKIIATVVNVG